MWGRVDCEGWLKMDKRVVKVNRHHDEFFNEDTVYFKKAKFNTNGKFWWSVADIKEYFGEAFNICNADCQCAKKVCA